MGWGPTDIAGITSGSGLHKFSDPVFWIDSRDARAVETIARLAGTSYDDAVREAIHFFAEVLEKLEGLSDVERLVVHERGDDLQFRQPADNK